MSDPLIRALDDYVVLEPGKPEQLLSVNKAKATVRWRKEIACILAGNLITSAY